MTIEEKIFYGQMVKFNEDEKFIESVILHFDTENENGWAAMSGSLDAFFARLAKSKKGVAGCYQHDTSILIGVWKDFVIENKALSAKLYFVETPFVKETVIPQVKAGILQGSSPSIAPIKDMWNSDKNIYEIIEGALCEISLVGLPADFRADIRQMKASLKQQENKQKDFELNLLTL